MKETINLSEPVFSLIADRRPTPLNVWPHLPTADYYQETSLSAKHWIRPLSPSPQAGRELVDETLASAADGEKTSLEQLPATDDAVYLSPPRDGAVTSRLRSASTYPVLSLEPNDLHLLSTTIFYISNRLTFSHPSPRFCLISTYCII